MNDDTTPCRSDGHDEQWVAFLQLLRPAPIVSATDGFSNWNLMSSNVHQQFWHWIKGYSRPTVIKSTGQKVVNDFHLGAVVIRNVVATECTPHAANNFLASEEWILPPSRAFFT